MLCYFITLGIATSGAVIIGHAWDCACTRGTSSTRARGAAQASSPPTRGALLPAHTSTRANARPSVTWAARRGTTSRRVPRSSVWDGLSTSSSTITRIGHGSRRAPPVSLVELLEDPSPEQPWRSRIRLEPRNQKNRMRIVFMDKSHLQVQVNETVLPLAAESEQPKDFIQD